MTPDTLITHMVKEFKDHLKPLKVDCHEHPGKFVWAELKEISYNAPAVFISCLGWSPADEQDASRVAGFGQVAYRVRFVAGIVTKNNKSANARNQEARLIGTSITNLLSRQDWSKPDVLEAEKARCEALFVRDAEADNQSLWQLDWWHVMAFDDESADSTINDFITAHGTHYGEPGAHTDVEGNDLLTSEDTVTLPQNTE